MSFLNPLFAFFFFMIMVVGAEAASLSPSVQKITNQSIELYNKQKYPEAMKLLDSIRQSREQNIIWYYYYGLNQARLRLYDEALANLYVFIKRAEPAKSARAYYFVGLIQFYRGEYEQAANTLEISLDLSTDPQLDRVIDRLIERTLKYREYYETHKATNITFLAGYNYDSNVLNLSQALSSENLTGNVFNYGLSVSHRVIDQYNFIFEPSIAVLDTYTLNSGFKANNTVQANDMLQVLLSTPVIFYFDDAKSSTRYDFSLNAYTSYLPLNSSERELYLSSFFIKGKTLTQLSSRFNLNVIGTIATDRSYGFSTEDDDASGLRVELYSNIVQFLSKERNYSLTYDISGAMKNSVGVNPRFSKYAAGLALGFPSFFTSASSLRLGFENITYKDKATPRTDNKTTLDYVFTKRLSHHTSYAFSMGADSNASNVELYKYSDFNVGVQFLTGFGF